MIGQSVSRVDGLTKVTGQEKFISDIEVPDALTGKVVRSTIASGMIKSIEFDPSFDWNCVITITAKDITGKNEVAIIERDHPALASDRVNYAGEAICLIAGEEKSAVEEAARHIKVNYEPLPGVFTIEESISRKAIVREPDNIIYQCSIKRGEVKQGFAHSDLIVEQTYETGAAEHAYLEPNGVIAFPLNGGKGIKIIGSMQCPFYVRSALTNALGLPEQMVQVQQVATGGGFGGKEDIPSILAVHASLLALKAGKPVKMIYDRTEDIISTSKRHPSLIRHRTGVSKDGKLIAMQIEIYLDGGAYTTLSPVVLQRSVIHATGPYRCPNVMVTGKIMATNNAPRGAFRGFGAPQSAFAVERQMDLIAKKLGFNPFELRRKNAFLPGDITATGQRLKESTSAKLVLERCEKLSGFSWKFKEYGEIASKNKTSPPLKKKRKARGIGISLFWHGGGFTGAGEERIKAVVTATLHGKPARVEILASSTEMGQGYLTAIKQIASKTLEIPLSRIIVNLPDTSIVPDSGPTVASRTTLIVGTVVHEVCNKIKHALITFVKRQNIQGQNPDVKLFYRNGSFYCRNGVTLETFDSAVEKYLSTGGQSQFHAQYKLPEGYSWSDEKMEGDAYPVYSWAADAIEVEVDTDTFEVTPVKAVMVFDIGKAINPMAAEGQFEGGTLQSIGWALVEEIKHENGRILNDRLTTYIIPTSADAPEYESEIVEIPFCGGPFGAKGLGELPYDGAASAVVSAIENALGIRINKIPATPEYLLERWYKK